MSCDHKHLRDGLVGHLAGVQADRMGKAGMRIAAIRDRIVSNATVAACRARRSWQILQSSRPVGKADTGRR